MWSPGDDNDVIEGGLGNDTLQFAGANVAETITLNANGSRLRFTRDIASVVLDLNAVERVNVSASGGADTISFTDLSATGVKQVAIDLSSFGNPAGDAEPDTIQIAGTTTTPILTTLGTGTMTITWSGVKISAIGVEPANDRLIMQTTTGVPAPVLHPLQNPRSHKPTKMRIPQRVLELHPRKQHRRLTVAAGVRMEKLRPPCESAVMDILHEKGQTGRACWRT